METAQDKSYNRMEWFFYIIILPLLFTMILTGVLLYFLGVNVVQSLQLWLNQVPYVESIVPDPSPEAGEAMTPQEEAALLNQRLAQLSSELTSRDSELEQLQKIADERESKIKELEEQIKGLEQSLEEKRISEETQQIEIKKLAQLYEGMSASRAAPIIEALTLEEAVLVMKAMKTDRQAEIFSKMDPQKAADISILLKDTQLNENDQIAALQQRIKILTDSLSESAVLIRDKEKVINTYAQMPADQAARILSGMMNTNQQKALMIISGLDDGVRSAILAEIARTDVQLAVKITDALLAN